MAGLRQAIHDMGTRRKSANLVQMLLHRTVFHSVPQLYLQLTHLTFLGFRVAYATKPLWFWINVGLKVSFLHSRSFAACLTNDALPAEQRVYIKSRSWHIWWGIFGWMAADTMLRSIAVIVAIKSMGLFACERRCSI